MNLLKTAETLIYAREDFGLTCPIFALCDSPFYREFNRDIPLLQEAFVDRMYTNEKALASRNLEGSVIENVNAAMEQYESFCEGKEVKTIEGSFIKISPQTVCIHGDNPASLDILKAIKKGNND